MFSLKNEKKRGYKKLNLTEGEFALRTFFQGDKKTLFSLIFIVSQLH